MSNNLRQIAKDLRSFVKRCKDVHYSDSLLITFLVTGLLTTFAPTVIRADVAEEQQEVSAEAYDSITDLRQSFIRARKENKKALRGANTELAQLLKQGDQVIKSPWASFQFGTGYTNNDWGTTYKGRGGKKLEYFSGKNDLTKYVFDASKHEYGATNLNVARNREPNSLVINPANRHEAYTPTEVAKIDPLKMEPYKNFAIDASVTAPNAGRYPFSIGQDPANPSRTTFTAMQFLDRSQEYFIRHAGHTRSDWGYTGYTKFVGDIREPLKSDNLNASTTGSANANANANANATGNAATISVTSGATNYYDAHGNNILKTVGEMSNITSGTFNFGHGSTTGSDSSVSGSGTTGDPWVNNYYYDYSANSYFNLSSDIGNLSGNDLLYAINNHNHHTASPVFSLTATTPTNRSMLYVDKGLGLTGSTFSIGSLEAGNISTNSHSGITVSANGNLNESGNSFTIYGEKNNGIYNLGTLTSSSDFEIKTGTKNNNGINNNNGTVVSGSSFIIRGTENNGINNAGANSNVRTTGGTFDIYESKNNGVNSAAGNVTLNNNTFNIYGDGAATQANNGINNSGSSVLSVHNGTFNIQADNTNGIYNTSSGDVNITGPTTFDTHDTKNSTGIAHKGSGTLTIKDPNTALPAYTPINNNITGEKNNGILLNGSAATAKLVIGDRNNTLNDNITYNIGSSTTITKESNGIRVTKGTAEINNVTFNVGAGTSNTTLDYTNNGILAETTDSELTVYSSTFNIKNYENNGIVINGTGASKNNEVLHSKFTISNDYNYTVGNENKYDNSKKTGILLKGIVDGNIGYQYNNGVTNVINYADAHNPNQYIIEGRANNKETQRTSAIYLDSTTGANLKIGGQFKINNGSAGNYNSGVYVKNSATTSSSANVINGFYTINGGQYNTGTFIDKAKVDNIGDSHPNRHNRSKYSIGGAGASYNSGTFVREGKVTNIQGQYVIETGTGDWNTGVLLTKTSEVDRIQSDFTINSNNNDGLFVDKDSKVKNLTYSTFVVNSGNSNGAYMEHFESSQTNVGHTTFRVGPTIGTTASAGGIDNSTGFTVYDRGDDAPGKIVMTATDFSVKGSKVDGTTTHSSGLYLRRIKDVEITGHLLDGRDSRFTLANGATGITIDNTVGTDARDTKGATWNSPFKAGTLTLTLKTNSNTVPLNSPTDKSNRAVAMNIGNDGSQRNTGINIQGGSFYLPDILTPNADEYNQTDKHNENKIKITNAYTTTDKKDRGIDMTIGKNNVSGYNTGFSNVGYVYKLDIKNGVDIDGTIQEGYGSLVVNGKNNMVFANRGIIDSGDIKLKNIIVTGSDNTVAFFDKMDSNRPHYWPNTTTPTNLGGVGWLNGNLYLQGTIGEAGTTSDTVTGNVGVYAHSGQRKGLNQALALGNPSGITTTALNIKGLKIGFGAKSDSGVLVYADRGTVVEVENKIQSEDDTSKYLTTNTSPAPAAGDMTISDGVQFDDTNKHNVWGYDISYNNLSKNTTMFYSTGIYKAAENGLMLSADGKFNDAPTEITVKSNVDMVSRQGIAYYADKGGKVIVGDTTNKYDTRAGGYKSIIAQATGGTGTVKSEVEIHGKIIAADSNLLGQLRNTTGGATAVGAPTSDLDNTYQNVGAIALDGGKVKIYNSDAATTVKEGDANAKVGTNDKSLIYGLGAYAKGTGSEVIFDGGANKGSATVVSGEDGALFATENGGIQFNGNIVNQNNNVYGQKIKAGSDLNGSLAATDYTVSGERWGKGYASRANQDNDHTNVTPFYVKQTAANDKAYIQFNHNTNIDMYDGVLLTANKYHYDRGLYGSSINSTNSSDWDYNGSFSDYAKTSDVHFNNAKYRGMEKVTVHILGDANHKGVNLGTINQAEKALKWDGDQDKTTTTGYLDSVAKYAGILKITNSGSAGNNKSTSGGYEFKSAILNSELEITKGGAASLTVDLQDNVNTGSTPKNDPFNNISMESTLVTIGDGVKVTGDIAHYKDQSNVEHNYKAGQGLNMANSLYRWSKINDPNAQYIRSHVSKSGYINYGKVDVYGGTSKEGSNANDINITGINVAYGTVKNGDGNTKAGEVIVDHGIGIAGTDGSILINGKNSKIEVTGKYVKAGTNNNRTDSNESNATGQNYGMVGISTNNVKDNDYYRNTFRANAANKPENARYGTNTISLANNDGKITVDGTLAVGMFAKNAKYDGSLGSNDSNEGALQENVSITYSNLESSSNPDLIKVNASNTNKNHRGIGIALVDKGQENTVNRRGGIINLSTLNKGINQTADIVTGYRGIGIYGESVDISFGGNATTKGVTVETKNNGAAIWVMDDSNIGTEDNHANKDVINYNYKGDNNANAYGVVFGSTSDATNYKTTAYNYLDIKFNNNNNTTGLKLSDENKTTTVGTYKGIAGILVNTSKDDTVVNKGSIKEDTSKTYIRTYGAVVNKGNFKNWGDITLNSSLMEQASKVTNEDLKKVNIGILANDSDINNTSIEHHGDIKIGNTSGTDAEKNIGGFGIYGYNIKTGAKEDGTDSTITINRNSYGIFSGDGNVDIQGTKLLVGNDSVLGHTQNSWIDNNNVTHLYNRQSAYSSTNDLLSGRQTDAAYGVYIGSNEGLSKKDRNVNVSANMDIDRYSYGIVIAENKGPATTKVTIGSKTFSPTINLASNTTAGGQVKSEAPNINTKKNLDYLEQGNAVYYYSADQNSSASSYANVKMNGDYNTAYYTKGSVTLEKEGSIDLRSQYDLPLREANDKHQTVGYGNVGIVSLNKDTPSINRGTITTGLSDVPNMRYSAAMAAGRNVFDANGQSTGTDQGYIINEGEIVVQEKEGIGMFATGEGSRAINRGNIRLKGDKTIGMYLDNKAIGVNEGLIEGNATQLSGIVAINGAYIKNYGTIRVTGNDSHSIVTDSSKFLVDKDGNPVKVLKATDPEYSSSAAVTAGQVNKDDTYDYKGTEISDIEEGSAGNPKTTGVTTTIIAPDLVPMPKVYIDGVDTPIFNVETDAATPGAWGEKITVSNTIQNGGTRIIDLSTKDEFGNPAWGNYHREQLSQITSIGMYVDTSGVKYTKPIEGIENLRNLGKIDMYYGIEATQYTNSKAIRIGDKIEEGPNGSIITTPSNILKPFNDILSSGTIKTNPLSASLTWQVQEQKDATGKRLVAVHMSKIPYHSFAQKGDESLINFANNLDNLYEIARPGSSEKMIFNTLNSFGNGQGNLLAQAFDQMRGHIYGGIQQRINATSNLLTDELAQLRREGTASKDSNKIKAFGRREEYKTDTAGIPDWHSNAGGFIYQHEDETVKLGDRSGWYAGAVNNYFTFRDLARSYENQAMLKAGLFKQTPLDEDGTLTFTIGGDAFIGKTNTKRRYTIGAVENLKEYRAKSDYYSYGADINAKLEKEFRLTEGFSIVPNLGLDTQYGRFSTINEEGDMALKIKSNDYYSIKPNAGVDFRYAQPVFKKSNFVASLGLTYETELGRLSGVKNEAQIKGAWTDYYTIKGDKENRKGNFKSDLNLGLDNGRLGFTVNTGYETKGHNFKAGLGLRVLF